MAAFDDLIALAEVSAAHRELLGAFELAQSSGKAAWKKIDGADALELTEGTFFPTHLENDPGTNESYWSKIGAVLFAGAALSGDGAWSWRDERDSGLFWLAALATVGLIGIAVACLLRGRNAERARRPLVYKHGMYLLDDALIERAGSDADRCRVFPVQRLRRFEYRNVSVGSGSHHTLYVGTKLDSGELDWTPTIGRGIVAPLEKWLAAKRSDGE